MSNYYLLAGIIDSNLQYKPIKINKLLIANAQIKYRKISICEPKILNKNRN